MFHPALVSWPETRCHPAIFARPLNSSPISCRENQSRQENVLVLFGRNGKMFGRHGHRLLQASLIQAFFGIRFERQLMEQVRYNILFRWFNSLTMDAAIEARP